ncbi:DUF4402 domain-containing protein [Salinimicrobium tongyeongense]|uniref:DUF4402 domain-containing protein n=2 Tax=Salinimicrobium tongyeongense TaxID=2809707 RepID=A0ABY6NVL8_9FLAO|nr:DUF4402 domain-containing protein [Salinimicrobium tongyeongense]
MVFIVLSLIGASAFAQASATASFTASATIIQPIGITTTSNMNFANVDAGEGGEVILTPSNTRLTTGNVLLDSEENVSAAAFEVTGEEGFAFSLSLPEGEYVLANGSESMIIKDFTSSLAEGETLAGGTKVITVGATLAVNPHQTPGTYNSMTPMNVTVNYN